MKKLLQSGTGMITKWDSFLFLQSGTIVITKWDSFFITNWEGVITKWDRYYKVGRLLQSGL